MMISFLINDAIDDDASILINDVIDGNDVLFLINDVTDNYDFSIQRCHR